MKQAEWEQSGPAEETAAQPEPAAQPRQANEAAAPLLGQEGDSLAALQAENRRLQTQVYAYERALAALQTENDELTAKNERLEMRLKHLGEVLNSPHKSRPKAAAPAPAIDAAEALELGAKTSELSAGLLKELDRISGQ